MINDLLNNWNKYTLTVQSDRGLLTLNWNYVEPLAQYVTLQTGLFGGAGKEISQQLFFEQFPKWAQTQWKQFHSIAGYAMPEDATFIDIGSGVGINDLLMAQYCKDSKFVLVDRDTVEFKKGIYYSNNYPFYNNWQPTNDAIRTTGLDHTRFSMQTPEQDWPEADCITSLFSWCFHYPKDVYWEKVLNSLKVGGRLVLDVRLLHSNDVIGEITEAMKFKPHKDPIPNLIPEWIDNYPSPNPEVMGYRCVWVRQ